MDIKSMDKRKYQRRPGGKRKPKHKAYCILEEEREEGTYLYFPVAASYAPYEIAGSRPESYLAGMPNFFGGNKEQGEADSMALAREIEEETQGNIQVEISEAALEELFRSDEKNGDTYRFYLIKTENCNILNFNWQGGTVFPLCSYEERPKNDRKPASWYEHRFLIRMEKGRFLDFVQSLLRVRDIRDQEERKAQTARLFLDQDIAWNGTVTSVNNWNGSHTASAFFNFR